MKLIISFLIFLVLVFSSLLYSFNDETKIINENLLIGKCWDEQIILPDYFYNDSSILCFKENGKYSRQGDMYIQTEGKYTIINDTLFIHYACTNICNKSKCGIQKYVMQDDSNLNLVYVR